MAEFEIPTVSEDEMRELNEAGFIAVLRWVRPTKSSTLFRTREALVQARKSRAAQPSARGGKRA